MRIFYYIIYIYLFLVCHGKRVATRTVYGSPHFVKRTVRETNEDNDNEVLEVPNSMYETPRFRQYDPAMYVHQAPRIISRSNGEYPGYEVRKREYYPDMKTGRDASLEVVLDPKARQIDVGDTPDSQDNYELSGWKNSKDDVYGYDNDQYSQGNQDQVVNLIYPVRRSDRMSIRDNPGSPVAAGSSQSFSQNKNVRNAQDYDNQGQLVYKATINEPETADISSQKFKRHSRTKKREIFEKHLTKNEANDNEERKAEKITRDVPYDGNNEENADKQRKKKRNVPNWSNEQIIALKDSLSMLQENSGEYDNLKSILSDMGLVENSAIKRETNSEEGNAEEYEKEDENLNANDITMVKNDNKWIKNEDTAQKSLHKRELHDSNNKKVKKRSEKITYKKNLESKQENDEDENAVNADSERDKRDSEINVKNPDTNSPDIMKGLEKSGDLTLSGNKSPLASDEKSESDTIGNERLSRTATEKEILDKRYVNADDEDYEEKVENEIQAKIDAIKEKVKREILLQKQKHPSSRIKRDTLLDSENENIKPEFISNESLEPHIRTRRKTDGDKTEKAIQSNENQNFSAIDQVTPLVINDNLEAHRRVRRDTDRQEQDIDEDTSQEKVDKRQLRKQSNAISPQKEIEKLQTKDENEDEEDIKREDSEETLNIPNSQPNKLERKKRANNILPEHKMVFRPYLSSQDEEEEGDGGEFDNAYDQTYVEKREAYEPDYQYFENKDTSNDDYQPEKMVNMETAPEKRRRRSHTSYVEEDNGNFRQQNIRKRLPKEFVRNKRDNENAQLHGGGMISSRKSSLKNRGIQDERDKRGEGVDVDNSEQSESDSDNEFFGALPQNYQEGELNRYKRVKRNDETKSSEVT